MAEEEVEKCIKSELCYLGYKPNCYGTQYLMEAIYILYININNPNYDCNLKRNVYPIIAKRHNKNVLNIKCNIVNATDDMVCGCKEEKLIDYFGYYCFAKPGPKRIMETVLNKVQMKCGIR